MNENDTDAYKDVARKYKETMEEAKRITEEEQADSNASDGSTASYYDVDLVLNGCVVRVRCQDIINALNMNGQRAEAFRALWRWGRSSHSSVERDAKKTIFNMKEEILRLITYVYTGRSND